MTVPLTASLNRLAGTWGLGDEEAARRAFGGTGGLLKVLNLAASSEGTPEVPGQAGGNCGSITGTGGTYLGNNIATPFKVNTDQILTGLQYYVSVGPVVAGKKIGIASNHSNPPTYVASGTVASTVGTGNWCSITFDAEVTLTAGTQYYFIAADEMGCAVPSANATLAGIVNVSGDSYYGATFASGPIGYQAQFRLIAKAVTAVPAVPGVAGNFGEVAAALNALAGTWGLEADAAAARIEEA